MRIDDGRDCGIAQHCGVAAACAAEAVWHGWRLCWIALLCQQQVLVLAGAGAALLCQQRLVLLIQGGFACEDRRYAVAEVL